MWTNPGKQVERFTTQLDTSKKSAGVVPQLRKDEMQRIKISFGAANYNSLEINAKQLTVLASKLGQPISPMIKPSKPLEQRYVNFSVQA